MEALKNQKEIIKIVKRIANSPLKKDSHLYPQFKEKKIVDAVNQWKEDYESHEFQPAIILLRVVLAANRKYNTHVKPNIDRIMMDYPDLNSFRSLENLMNSMTLEEFYKFWGHKNLKKDNVLKNLLDAIKQLRNKYNITDDLKLMYKWGSEIDILDYESDNVGRIKNIGLATIQHLRMDFGINTVKPDQRVMEVLQREFGFKKVNQIKAIRLVEEISKIVEIPVRKLDLIFVNYGSGYYDNRNYNSQIKLRREIAKKLKEHGVKEDIIFDSTGITL